MGPADRPRPVRALLVDRTFGPFFAGNLISNSGNWFQNVAAGVLVFELTRSNTLVGVVGMVQFAATMLLSPWAGALTDRVDRRRLLLGAQLVSASGAAVLAVWVGLAGVDGLPGIWPIFAATLVIGIGYALSLASMQAVVPALVPRADLGQAIALNSASFNLARAVGPALAGVTIAAAGTAAAFGVNTVSFFALVVALLIIRTRPVQRSTDGDRSVVAGLRYVRQRPAMVALLSATLAVGFATDPVNTLTPAFADVLGQSDAFVGFQVAAFGGGAAVTTFGVASLRRWLGQRRLASLGLLILSIGMAGFAGAFTPVMALVTLAVAGAGFLVAITSLNTQLQEQVSEDLRGRVMALWGMAFLGSRPLAALLDGVIADLVSPRVAVLVAAGLSLAGMAVLRGTALASAEAEASSDQPVS